MSAIGTKQTSSSALRRAHTRTSSFPLLAATKPLKTSLTWFHAFSFFMDATLKEIDRAVRDLGAKGIQVFTNVAGKPLSAPEFRPIFKRMHRYRRRGGDPLLLDVGGAG